MNHKDPVFKCQILDDWITSMATTPVKKILFLCNMFGDYAELRTRNHKKINFGIDNVRRSEVANNGKFLITASTDNYARMTKWSQETKQLLHTWQNKIEGHVWSLKLSHDHKFLFVGLNRGNIEIFDLTKNQTIFNQQVLKDIVRSVCFSQNNLSAFITDHHGFINLLQWKPDSTTEKDFQFKPNPKFVSTYCYELCFTKDDKNLLFASKQSLIVFDTQTKTVSKRFNVKFAIWAINLIDDGKRAQITEEDGRWSILNIETMELSELHQIDLQEKTLCKVALI